MRSSPCGECGGIATWCGKLVSKTLPRPAGRLYHRSHCRAWPRSNATITRLRRSRIEIKRCTEDCWETRSAKPKVRNGKCTGNECGIRGFGRTRRRNHYRIFSMGQTPCLPKLILSLGPCGRRDDGERPGCHRLRGSPFASVSFQAVGIGRIWGFAHINVRLFHRDGRVHVSPKLTFASARRWRPSKSVWQSRRGQPTPLGFIILFAVRKRLNRQRRGASIRGSLGFSSRSRIAPKTTCRRPSYIP